MVGIMCLSFENIVSGGDFYFDIEDDVLLVFDVVGIGLLVLDIKVYVQGDVIWLFSEGLLSCYVEMNIVNDGVVINGVGDDLYVSLFNGNYFFFNVQDGDGKVVVNMIDVFGGYEFYVGGSMIVEEVVVKLQINWFDYVFEVDYLCFDIKEWVVFI